MYTLASFVYFGVLLLVCEASKHLVEHIELFQGNRLLTSKSSFTPSIVTLKRITLRNPFATVHVEHYQACYNCDNLIRILKRSRDCLLYTKKETYCSLFIVNT